MAALEIYKGDIRTLKVDAIVNAANSSLLGGGGVDGAIHRAAGPKLLEECRTLHGCKTGEAKITKGYNLPAKHVIHTVGPIYGRENGRKNELLANCYLNSMKVAQENKIHTLAFPCISTGVYRFPKDKAAEIVIRTIKHFIKENPDVFEKIIFCVFSDEDFGLYQQQIQSSF